MNYIFYDSEFTSLTKDNKLISVGLVNGENYFYAEFNDYPREGLDQFIISNIIPQLKYNNVDKFYEKTEVMEQVFVNIKGDSATIKGHLLDWLFNVCKIHSQNVIVADVGHYDFVLLIDLLWGNALNMPRYICPFYLDFVNILKSINPEMNWFDLFDYDREKLMNIMNDELKHNALNDAILLKHIYNRYIKGK